MNYLTTGDSNKRHGVATSKLTGRIQVCQKEERISAHSNGQLLRTSCARMWVETCEHRHEGPESDQIPAQAR